jgi:hypothetical protein
LANLLEARGINCPNNALCLKLKSVCPKKPARMFSRAG